MRELIKDENGDGTGYVILAMAIIMAPMVTYMLVEEYLKKKEQRRKEEHKTRVEERVREQESIASNMDSKYLIDNIEELLIGDYEKATKRELLKKARKFVDNSNDEYMKKLFLLKLCDAYSEKLDYDQCRTNIRNTISNTLGEYSIYDHNAFIEAVKSEATLNYPNAARYYEQCGRLRDAAQMRRKMMDGMRPVIQQGPVIQQDQRSIHVSDSALVRSNVGFFDGKEVYKKRELD